MLVDADLSGLPAFLTPKPGLNSGFMLPQVTAAALVSENKQRATPASVDSIPTSANQEDHVSMAAHGALRLLPMAQNAKAIVGVELIAAAQGCDFHRPLTSSAPLEAVRSVLRDRVPALDEDRYLHTDINEAIDLIHQGHDREARVRYLASGRRAPPGGPMTRIDETRTIRAPRGTQRSAKSWLTEAPLRMLMNNLDPDVGERPPRARRVRRHRARRA